MKDFIKIFSIGLIIGILFIFLGLSLYNSAYKKMQKKNYSTNQVIHFEAY